MGEIPTTSQPWEEICAKAQARRDKTVESVDAPNPSSNLPLNVTGLPRQLLSSREIEITENLPEELLPLLATGKLSALEVTDAFLRRAGLAQRLVNCVTELLPERARARAQELDAYFKEHGRPVGPLHGLPISVKELVGFKGLDLNLGYCSMVGNIQLQDAVILQILGKAGAVFHARTTEPQTVMHLETSSNLFGVTVNPFNRALTAGGSSGGEGALIGLRGSCLGIGSDIGGSIRSPAANNGLFGLRPTSYRLPLLGLDGEVLGQEHIVPVDGPLSTSIEGIKIFMKTVIEARPWLVEPSLVRLPWQETNVFHSAPPNQPLKIAVLWNDGIVKPHPPILRALRETVDKLKPLSHVEIVDWVPYQHDKAWEIIASLYFPDGGKIEADAIDSTGEPWRPLSKFIIKDNPYVRHLDITEVWEYTRQREIYRNSYAKVWNETATGLDEDGHLTGMVDVILCPVGPGAAPPLDCARYWGYTSQWNLLDYPSLVFPVTAVDPSVDRKETGYTPINEQDKYNYELYEPETYRDAPVSLQLVARRHEDEKLIQAYEVMAQHL